MNDHGRRSDVISLLFILMSFQNSLSDYACPQMCQCHEITLLANCSYLGNVSSFLAPLNISHLSTVLLLDGNSLDDTRLIIPWKSLSNLRKLSLKFNDIQTFERETLSLVTKLLYLDLSYNSLQKIPNEIKQLRRLKYLDLSDNDITYIDTDDLSGLTNLQTLLLTNSLRGISYGAFSFSYHLTSLLISGSNLSQNNSSCFEIFPWFGEMRHPFPLTELDLSHANIECLTNDTFKGLAFLERLNLNHNQIYSLPYDLIHNMTMLVELNFASNSLTDIPKAFFTFATHLQVLDLSLNNLTSVNNVLTKKLKSLEYLNLDENYISEPSPLDFRIFKRLRELYLSNNQLTEFPMVRKLLNLEILKVARNLISEIPPNALSRCRGLKTVDLGDNFLNSFALETHDLNDNIDSFNIRNNKISCDCNLLKYYEQMTNNRQDLAPEWVTRMFQDEDCQGSRRFQKTSLFEAIDYYYFDMICSHETPPDVLRVLIGSWLSLLLGIVCYIWIKTMCSARRKRKTWTSDEDKNGKHRKKEVSIRDEQLLNESPSIRSETAPIWEKEQLLEVPEGENYNEDLEMKLSEAKWKSMTETFV